MSIVKIVGSSVLLFVLVELAYSATPVTTASIEFESARDFIALLAQKTGNRKCQQQLRSVVEGLGNSSLWAVQMLDASAKIPIGLIVANTYQLGHFDECVDISASAMRGKYCLLDVEFAPTTIKYPDYHTRRLENEFSLQYDPYGLVWDKFKVTADPSKKRRDKFHMGICVPSECDYEEINALAQYSFSLIGLRYGVDFNVTTGPNACTTKSDDPLPFGAIIFLYFCAFMVGAVVLTTAWDLLKNGSKAQSGSEHHLFESFSLHRTMNKLSLPDKSDDLNVFHGMKFYSIALIMLGHRCVHSYGAPFFNPEFLEERYRKYQDMFLLNGSLIVDTFFMIGGYLTCYGIILSHPPGKKIRLFPIYLYRWLRIIPMYMLIVAFYANVLEHIGSGPIWHTKVGREASRCRENWWTNLFFLNNYIKNEEMCLFQSWYVSCDMHFTLLAPLLIRAMINRPVRGIAQLMIVIIATIFVPFFYTYQYNHDGVLRVYMQIFEDLPKNRTFADMYIKSHHRAVPYFIGVAAAFIFIHLKKINFRFTKTMLWTGSFISTSLSIWAIWGAWCFYIPGRKYDAMENAIYAAVHRVAWAVAMAWIPVAGGFRAFGIIQPILSKQALAPLSRLSFGAFLVHGIVQIYFTGSMRSPEYISFPKLFWMTAGDTVFSFLISLLLHLFFESPLNGIFKTVLTTPQSKTKIEVTQLHKDDSKKR